MDNNKTDRLSVSVADAAQALGISRSSMYVEIKRGGIRTFKLAGRLLIPWTELTSLMERSSRSEPGKDQPNAKDLVEAGE
jgi:predicted DNA-binding transcriptional regulator AlpA|tara:strand:+ start:6955 stop:7194 length:240 start_codon:yes stop_codon:yes gene_type:complete